MYIMLQFSTYIYTNTVFTTVGINKPGPCEKVEKSIMVGGEGGDLGARSGMGEGGGGEREERGHAKRKTRLSPSTAYRQNTHCSFVFFCLFLFFNLHI